MTLPATSLGSLLPDFLWHGKNQSPIWVSQRGFLLREAECNPHGCPKMAKGLWLFVWYQICQPIYGSCTGSVPRPTPLPHQASLEQTSPCIREGNWLDSPSRISSRPGLASWLFIFMYHSGGKWRIKSQRLLLLLPRKNMASRKMLLGWEVPENEKLDPPKLRNRIVSLPISNHWGHRTALPSPADGPIGRGSQSFEIRKILRLHRRKWWLSSVRFFSTQPKSFWVLIMYLYNLQKMSEWLYKILAKKPGLEILPITQTWEAIKTSGVTFLLLNNLY